MDQVICTEMATEVYTCPRVGVRLNKSVPLAYLHQSKCFSRWNCKARFVKLRLNWNSSLPESSAPREVFAFSAEW